MQREEREARMDERGRGREGVKRSKFRVTCRKKEPLRNFAFQHKNCKSKFSHNIVWGVCESTSRNIRKNGLSCLPVRAKRRNTGCGLTSPISNSKEWGTKSRDQRIWAYKISVCFLTTICSVLCRFASLLEGKDWNLVVSKLREFLLVMLDPESSHVPIMKCFDQ